ncbi:NUDIX hydrolase [Bacillus sp. JJ1122]|uniref:NUDIX hydrolase n=1 Tax=Bacillus sp. JJ1122 TaxID=3122951 RepID=UPI002FFE7D1F
MKSWMTIESEYIYKTPFGNLRKDKCQLPNGVIIDDYYVNEYSDWVNAVVITKENQILLVEQYRYAGNDSFLEIPAGKIEYGETFEQGILREIREETGYISDTEPIKLGEFMVNPATQTNKVITFLIKDAYKAYEPDFDQTEDLQLHLEDFEKFGKQMKDHNIRTQLFTANAYLMAKVYLREFDSKHINSL